MSKVIQYRVRPVVRYIVTQYSEDTDGAGRALCGESSLRGEFASRDLANDIASSLAIAARVNFSHAEVTMDGLPVEFVAVQA